MNKHVHITEIGYWTDDDREYLVLHVTVTHNRFIVEELDWDAPFDLPTEQISSFIAASHDCESWTYQTMWTLPHIPGRRHFRQLRIDLLD